MADKSLQLILEGLSQAVSEPAGRPLHGSKTVAGLFPTTAAARQAAQQCKEAGYLHVARTETKGKSTVEVCTITEKGIAYLLSQVSPKQVLEEFVKAVEARGQQVGQLVEAARQCQATFETMKSQVARILTQVKSPLPATNGPALSPNGPAPWKTEALTFLTHWQKNKPNEDCPLPELFAHVQQVAPSLTIGQFHDGLRRLHDGEQIYLHPWTGPLYEIPQPACALLVGHVVVYYASRRSAE